MKIVNLADNSSSLPEFRDLTPEETAEALKLLQERYTPEDLKRLSEIDPGEYSGGEMGEFLEELKRAAQE